MNMPDLPAELTDFKPELGLILGSGLGFFADERIEVVGRLPYGEIDGFPVSTVPGHAGQFVWGHLEGRRVLCMQGRFHFYEGYRMEQLTLPIRMMHQLGVQTLFLTNAAGGINASYQPGDFMLIEDHINFLGTNPLIGSSAEAGVRFPDMTEVYDKALRDQIGHWAHAAGMDLKAGIYLATTGPSFETPAEIRAFARLGADAVGMSTVPEVILARHCGMRVAAISNITNLAAGLSDEELSHETTMAMADKGAESLRRLVTGWLEGLSG